MGYCKLLCLYGFQEDLKNSLKCSGKNVPGVRLTDQCTHMSLWVRNIVVFWLGLATTIRSVLFFSDMEYVLDPP